MGAFIKGMEPPLLLDPIDKRAGSNAVGCTVLLVAGDESPEGDPASAALL